MTLGVAPFLERPHERTPSIQFKMHAVLHGHLFSGSDELASLIMMEVHSSVEAIRDVELRMKFTASQPDERNPEVLDIMPSGPLQFAQESQNAQAPTFGDVTDQMVGSILRGGIRDRQNTALWNTKGDVSLSLLKPAVLLRRYGTGLIEVFCEAHMIMDRKSMLHKLRGSFKLVIDPKKQTEQWSVALQNLQEFMKDIKKAGQNSASVLMTMDEESRRCLMSLYAPEQQLHYLFSLQKTLLSSTKTWILNDNQYRRWLSDDGPQVLWIHGRPGLGKTMMAAFLLENIHKLPVITRQDKKTVVAYYFCMPASHRTNVTSTVVGSLIRQAILQKPSLIKHLLKEYGQLQDGKELFTNHTLLWEVLKHIISDPEVEVAYFVIDGLEQCDEGLLNILKDETKFPCSKHNESSTTPHCKERWILVSRDDPAVEAALSGFLDLDLSVNSASLLEEEIRALVNGLGLSEAARASLGEVLMDSANGSFTWLTFARDRMMRHPQMDLENLQRRLPKGLPQILDQTVEDLLHTPDNETRDIARAVIPVSTISCRPLPLKALAILSEPFETLAIPEDDLKDKIIAACSPLIQVHDDMISLVHASVKEYMTSSSGYAKFGSGSLRDLHGRVSARCLQYICEAFANTSSSDIHEYPVVHWMEHGSQSSQTPEELGTLFNNNPFFTGDSVIRKRWLAMYWIHRHGIRDAQPTNFTMMHIAAESGYSQLAEMLVQKGYVADVNAEDSSEMTPLHWAALHGHCEVARVLLNAKANMYSRAANRSSPLQLAINEGHKAMIQLLLEKGAGFDMEIRLTAKPDMKKLLGQHVQLAKLPEPKNMAVDHKFWGTVMDIGPSHSYHSRHIQVDEMLAPDGTFDELMADGQSNITKEERIVRWIHLPENNMTWVEILMAKILKSPEAVMNFLRPDLWSNRIRDAEKISARCLRPVYADFSPATVDQVATTNDSIAPKGATNRTMLVMPYLHWGTDQERLKLQNTIHLIQNGNNSLPYPGSEVYKAQHKHRKLLHEYLKQEHPLHVRRSLDQFYYLNLDDKDMEFRNEHQTLSKYYRENTKGGNADNFPLLMVDQLWLWVLNDNTVVTCFPPRWDNDDSCDPHNMTELVGAVERRLVTRGWPVAVESVSSFAELIANECSGILFDVAKYREKWLQVREIYEDAISDVANREIKLFQVFSDSLKHGRNWDASGGEKERYAINEEVDHLNTIKDIRDELNMIRTVFQTQKTVLEDSVMFSTVLTMIDRRIKDVERIDQQACQAQEALKHILDLKQKQANAEEAHFLSVQNIRSAEQGQAIMTFTIVTIVFAPLSFLTSFLALQIGEFPKLTLGYVLEILCKYPTQDTKGKGTYLQVIQSQQQQWWW